MEFNNQTLDKRCMSTVQLLLDIETLAHADYMTGTLNSGIPYLIEVHPAQLPCGTPGALSRDPDAAAVGAAAMPSRVAQLLEAGCMLVVMSLRPLSRGVHQVPIAQAWHVFCHTCCRLCRLTCMQAFRVSRSSV